MGVYEDYLNGQPITEEIAGLMSDGPMESERERTLPPRAEPPREDITNDDRVWLKRLKGEPGWMVYLHLMDRCIERRQQAAMLLSASDPLGKKEEIANAWAYVVALKTLLRDSMQEIENELSLVENQDV